MLKIKLTVALIILFTGFSFAQNADVIIGKYLLPNDLEVELFKQDGKYFGKIVGLNNYRDGETRDVKNSDSSKRNDLLLGKLIIKDLEYDAEEKIWVNGEMYGPDKGINVNLKITEVTETGIIIVGSKYIMRKTMEWKRI
ncbi:MAG: DUF2147 domain-containing protein [Bacteroidetes bacterium]|nr:MAG: DUF2147 domain-containing protein [Bacteroidota bacterium]